VPVVIVRTNNVPRPIVYGNELQGAQRRQAHALYGFLGTAFDDAQFVVYRRHVHYLGNFEGLLDDPEWDGVECDSATTGTLIKLCPDGDTCIVGSARNATMVLPSKISVAT
jgi:hypothetical protein